MNAPARRTLMIGLSVLSLLPMFHIPFPHRWVVGKTDSFKLADQTIKSIPSRKSLLPKTFQGGGWSQDKSRILKIEAQRNCQCALMQLLCIDRCNMFAFRVNTASQKLFANSNPLFLNTPCHRRTDKTHALLRLFEHSEPYPPPAPV